MRGDRVPVAGRDREARQVVRRDDVGREDAADGVAQHDVERCDRPDGGQHGREVILDRSHAGIVPRRRAQSDAAC